MSDLLVGSVFHIATDFVGEHWAKVMSGARGAEIVRDFEETPPNSRKPTPEDFCTEVLLTGSFSHDLDPMHLA